MISTFKFGKLIIWFAANMFTSKYKIKAQFTTEARCDPALENTPHNLTFMWNTTNTHDRVNVENHDSVLGFCDMGTARCTSILPVLATVDLTNISDILYLLNVRIKNTSRDPHFTMEGYWTLTYNSSPILFMSCKLKVLSIAQNITCEHYAMNQAVQLNCLSQKIYPEAKCLFTNNDFEMNKIISKSAVVYSHTILTGRVTYYRSSCAIVLPLNNLTKVTYNLTVTMYPNVTGSDSDLTFGSIKTVELELANPSLQLRDCPQIIEVGTSVTCTCEKSDPSLRNVSISWMDENQERVLTTSTVLHINVSQISYNYICVSKTLTGTVIDKFLYRPQAVVRPYNVDCLKENIQDDNIKISCSAVGVYPEANCKFITYDNKGKVMLQNETVATTYNFPLENTIHYRCEVIISKSFIQQDLLVVVTMYPYIEELETESLLLGTNVTVIINVSQEHFEEGCLKGENFKLICLILGTIIALIIIILAMMCLIHLFKKGAIRKVWHPNQGKKNGDQINNETNIENHETVSLYSADEKTDQV